MRPRDDRAGGTPAAEGAPADLRAARFAVSCTFALHGIAAGSWAARVPWVQQHLHLSAALLGLALLGTALGGIVAMALAGWSATRFGSRRTAWVGLVAVGVTVALPPLPPNVGTAALALMAFGAASGVVDVAQNAQAAEVERRYGRSVMPGMHGLWSVGALAGSATGGIAAGGGLAAPPHLALVGATVTIVGALVTNPLLRADSAAPSPSFAWPSRGLLLIALIGFCSLFAEAAAADWSAVYLTHSTVAGPGLAAGAYAAFSIAMAALRLSGNRLVDRYGGVAVVRVSATVGAVGLAVGLVVHNPIVGVAAFGLLGVGVACVIPLVFGGAGAAPGRSPDTSIASVATVSYAGWLAAPAIIGEVANGTSLTVALGLVAALTAVIAALAGALRLTAPEQGRRTPHTPRATHPWRPSRRRGPR